MTIDLHGSDPASWFIAAGTIGLALIALVALKQLSEIKRDRHIRVFADLGVRWGSAEMVEALRLSREYTAEQLLALFEAMEQEPFADPELERVRIENAKKRVTLMRIPNYFEEAAIIAKVGKLEPLLARDNLEGVAQVEWERWEPTIRFLQKADRLYYCGFEGLVPKNVGGV